MPAQVQPDLHHWYVQHCRLTVWHPGGIKLIQPRVNSTRDGLKSVCYQGAEIWNELPTSVNNTEDESEFKYRLNEWPGPVCKCGSCELCTFINIWTAFCHSPLILYAHMILLSWSYIYIYYIYTICELFAYFHMYLLVCMHVYTYIRVYAQIGVYACMYMCTLMFLILICVCILSSFHPHNHHLSPNCPKLMFLFVDCATVNNVYLILSYFILSYLILSYLILSYIILYYIILYYIILYYIILYYIILSWKSRTLSRVYKSVLVDKNKEYEMWVCVGVAFSQYYD